MIRPYRSDDFDAVTRFWFDAMEAAMPGLEERLGHTLEDARGYFADVVLRRNQVWIFELAESPVGYLGVSGEFIDRLYVNRAYFRRGIGRALLEQARSLSPIHLWLYTHQANKMARNFYEKNGFHPEKFGTSPAPESEPDVEYHWRAKG